MTHVRIENESTRGTLASCSTPITQRADGCDAPIGSLHFSAQALAKKGFKVFPYWPMQDGKCTCKTSDCGSPGKHPRYNGFPALATSDPAQIRQWWTATPDLGIGIHPENLLIIDVDGPIGHANLQRFEHDHQPLPPTYRVNSGNSEPHHYQLYYRCPDGYRVKNGPLSKRIPGYEKIDIKSGGGGQVAGAGNIHKSGGCYTWDGAEPNTVQDLPLAPSWLTDALGLVTEGWQPKKRPKRTRATGKVSDSYYEPGSDGEILLALRDKYPINGPGVRHANTLQATCYLLSVRRITPSRAVNLLREYLQLFASNFASDMETAIADAKLAVNSLAAKIATGNFDIAIDHNTIAANQKLHPQLQSYLDSLTNHPISTTTAFIRWSRLSSTEVGFISALLLRYQYEVFYHGKQEGFAFVESQILAMMATLGHKVGRTKYKEMKDKFIGGPKLGGGQRNPLRELFRCVAPAKHRGEVSLYIPVDVPQINHVELQNVRTKSQLAVERGIDTEIGKNPADSSQPAGDPQDVQRKAGTHLDRQTPTGEDRQTSQDNPPNSTDASTSGVRDTTTNGSTVLGRGLHPKKRTRDNPGNHKATKILSSERRTNALRGLPDPIAGSQSQGCVGNTQGFDIDLFESDDEEVRKVREALLEEDQRTAKQKVYDTLIIAQTSTGH